LFGGNFIYIYLTALFTSSVSFMAIPSFFKLQKNPCRVLGYILFFFCLHHNSSAQTGSSCSDAIPVNPSHYSCNLIDYASTDNEVWFSVIPASQEVTIKVGSPVAPADTPAAHIAVIALFEGNCNGLTLLAQSSQSDHDEMLELSARALTPGNTYYILVKEFVQMVGCRVCEKTVTYFGMCVQNNENFCGNDNILKTQMQSMPGFQQLIQQQEDLLKQMATNPISATAQYIIPVVVHIVEDPNIPQISYQQVESQINALNEAFSNFSQAGAYAVDTRIQFCLARVATPCLRKLVGWNS
jgi:hypothetical protein